MPEELCLHTSNLQNHQCADCTCHYHRTNYANEKVQHFRNRFATRS